MRYRPMVWGRLRGAGRSGSTLLFVEANPDGRDVVPGRARQRGIEQLGHDVHRRSARTQHSLQVAVAVTDGPASLRPWASTTPVLDDGHRVATSQAEANATVVVLACAITGLLPWMPHDGTSGSMLGRARSHQALPPTHHAALMRMRVPQGSSAMTPSPVSSVV
jgi:hypothetical protein